MGLFSRGTKEKRSYEVPEYLSTKEIIKQEKLLFSGLQPSGKNGWLLAFAAPMLGKDGQYTDAFPHYQGKKFEKMQQAFRSSWGEPNENTVSDQLREMLLGICTKEMDPIYEMTREYPKAQWDSQILRFSDFGAKHSEKIGDMENVYRRMRSFEFPLPEDTLYAYDLCRAANLVCIAVGLEALRPANAPYYLEQVAWAANQHYHSWEEYYGAFVVGRGLWLWKMGQFLAMSATVDCNVCRILLHSPSGACGKFPFDLAVDDCQVPSAYYRLHQAVTALESVDTEE